MIAELGEHLPLQPGLRRIHHLQGMNVESLGEHLPLQQGLRLHTRRGVHAAGCSRRASSTTTRIKTDHSRSYNSLRRLGEHLPLQQGLRHH